LDTEGVKCHTCSYSKLLSDADLTYECHAPFGEHDVMSLLYEFVKSGCIKIPFNVVSNQVTMHDAWPLRFRSATISKCDLKPQPSAHPFNTGDAK
jgi:hypothetical protein